MRTFLSNIWRAPCARRTGIKASALLMLAILLLCAGCSAQSSGNGALRDKLLQGVEDARKQSPAPEALAPLGAATPPAETIDLAASPWAEKLEGAWVEVSRFAEPESLSILFFTEDGRVYVGVENYWAMLEGEAISHDAWALENGAPQYIDNTSGDVGRIELDADGALIVKWGNGFSWIYARPDTPRATSLLMGGSYAGYFDLAENVKLAYLLLGEELSGDEAYATIWLNDAVWIDRDDQERIAQYGLEDYFADYDDEYFIVSDDHAWRPLFVMPEETVFCIVSYNDKGDVLHESVDFAAFLELAEERSSEDYEHPLLVYYYDEGTDSIVFAIREVYLA